MGRRSGLFFKDPQAYCRSCSTGGMQLRAGCMRALLRWGSVLLKDAPLASSPRPPAPPFTDSLFRRLEERPGLPAVGGVPGLDAGWATPCESRHRQRNGEAHRALWPPWKTGCRRRADRSPANRLFYRVDRDLLGDALGHRPAHNLAGEGVYHGCEIEPPKLCRYVGDVAHQSLLRPPRGESALYQVSRGSPGSTLLLDAVFSGRALSGEPGLLHDMEHALLARGDAAFSRFAVDAPVAVAALVPMEGFDDEPLRALFSLYLGVGFLREKMLVKPDFRLSSARMPS